ncbi:MAG TPA: sulfite exporter TauE/SafE family protein [Longimicrobiales bacterium]|nr:sulfite exporter TauE/SafE family protein [Longimicrobiales bacterium]
MHRARAPPRARRVAQHKRKGHRLLEIAGAAFIAGLVGSPHCVGMCGGFAAACSRPRSGLALWHAGRVTTYALLGALGGLAGGLLPGPRWVLVAVSLALLVWFAASLAELVPKPSLRIPVVVRLGSALAQRRHPGARYAFGMATGLLPCGMVYAALALSLAAGSPAGGALAMSAFGLGTVPALSLLSVGVRRFAAQGVWQRRAVATLVLVAGVWSIAQRGTRPGMSAHPTGRDVPAAHHAR